MQHPLNRSMYSTATESAASPVNRFEFQMQQSELENKQKYLRSPQRQITETNFKYMNVKLKLM